MAKTHVTAPGKELQCLVDELLVPDQNIESVIKGYMGVLSDPGAVGSACKLLDASAAARYGDRSRDAGVFYTPMPVARFICRRAIGSYLARRAREGAKRRSALQDIRVFDSSCGCGIFMEAALEELYLLNLGLQEGVVPSEFELKKRIIEKNLYGMDVDRYSIDIAALRLRLLLIPYNVPEPINMNLKCDNALFIKEAGIFDVIVGNPPYMRIKSMSPEIKFSLAKAVRDSGLYEYQEGNLNLYKLFMERNLGFLKEDGSMGLIIPSSFLNEATSEKLRKHIFDTCSLEEVIEIPERSRIFDRVNQATAILVLSRLGRDAAGFKLRLGKNIDSLDVDEGSILIGFDELSSFTDGRMEIPLLSEPTVEWAMMRRLKGIPPFKGRDGVPRIGQISVGNVDETFDKAFISEEPTGDIFVKGIHLGEYSVDLSPEGRQPRWVRKPDFLRKRPSARAVISQERIIGRNTQNKACARRLKFAMLPPGYLCSNSIKQIVITDTGIEPLYLLGLLNSSTLNWYFELFCSQNNIRNYRIEALPIVRAPRAIQKLFSRIARLILCSEENEFLDKTLMDSMAYELYFKDELRLARSLERIQGLDDVEFIRRAMSDEEIQNTITSLAGEKPFRIVKDATFKSQKGHPTHK